METERNKNIERHLFFDCGALESRGASSERLGVAEGSRASHMPTKEGAFGWKRRTERAQPTRETCALCAWPAAAGATTCAAVNARSGKKTRAQEIDFEFIMHEYNKNNDFGKQRTSVDESAATAATAAIAVGEASGIEFVCVCRVSL